MTYNSDRSISFLTYSGWLRQVKRLSAQEIGNLWDNHARNALLQAEYRQYLKKAGVIEKN